MIFLPFLLLVLGGLALAHYLKKYCERSEYSIWKYLLAISVNILLFCIYIRVVDSGCLAIWGCMDRWQDDYKIVEWAAIAASAIHALAMSYATLSKHEKR